MIKALLVKLLKLYVKEEEKPYSEYLTNSLIAIGLAILLIANYVYFFDESHKEIGRYLASGTLLIIAAFFIHAVNMLIKQLSGYKAMNSIDTAKSELVDIGKQVNELLLTDNLKNILPMLSKLAPAGVTILVSLYLLKRKILNKFK